MPPRLRTALVCLTIASWFWIHAKPGVLAYFQGDDMMNMYKAWDQPLPGLLAANLTPFTSLYRPAGAVFYRTMYALAGFHPRPFRVVVYALLAFNIWLAFRFTKLVTGSTEIAALAAFIGSFHHHLRDIYLNGGAVYDVLCYTFFFGAISVYIAARSRAAASLPWTLAFLALSVLAFNSKEMAITLPAVLWLYELIYRPAASPRYSLWIVTPGAPLALWMKTYSAAGLATNTAYTPHFRLDAFLLTTRSWLSQLFFLSDNALSASLAILILLTPLLVGLMTRRKHHLWLGALILILPLPVNFIELRGFFVMYIPYAAWAAWFATILVEARDWMLPRTSELARVGLFAFTGLALSVLYAYDSFRAFDFLDPSQPAIRELRFGLSEACGALPAGSRILLRGDPFPKDVYDPLFVARLFTHDLTLEVDRTVTVPERPLRFGPDYQCTLDYANGRYERRTN